MTYDSDTNILSSPPRLDSTVVYLSCIIPMFNIIYCSFIIRISLFLCFFLLSHLIYIWFHDSCLIHIFNSFMLCPQLKAMLNTPRQLNNDFLLQQLLQANGNNCCIIYMIYCTTFSVVYVAAFIFHDSALLIYYNKTCERERVISDSNENKHKKTDQKTCEKKR